MNLSVLPFIIFAALGLIAGLGHFVAIAREADSLVGKAGPWRAIGLRLGRTVLTIVVLGAASRHGWPVLLTAAVSFLIGRQFVMNRLGRLGTAP